MNAERCCNIPWKGSETVLLTKTASPLFLSVVSFRSTPNTVQKTHHSLLEVKQVELQPVEADALARDVAENEVAAI